MKFVQESLIASAMRAFATAFAAIIGLSIALVLVLFFLGGAFGGQKISEPRFDLRVEPDAEGRSELLSDSKKVILQISFDQVIGIGRLTQEKVIRNLESSQQGMLADGRVRAIFLKMNTPGGSAFDADAIYRAILSYKERYKIPVFAHVEGLCASGGMYIACAADKIYASDISLIGSVGVISEYFNISDVLNKVGVTPFVMTFGKYKDDMNPVRPWAPGEEERLRAISAYYYDRFVQIVTKARPRLSADKLKEDYGAQVFVAPVALDYGYIDYANASRADALRALAKAAGLNDGDYQVLSVHEEDMFGGFFSQDNVLWKKEIVHKIDGLSFLELEGKPLYLYRP